MLKGFTSILGASILLYFLSFCVFADAIGTYHKRRLVGYRCNCQLEFEDCMGKRISSTSSCNKMISRKYMCNMQFKQKHNRTYEKKTRIDFCKNYD